MFPNRLQYNQNLLTTSEAFRFNFASFVLLYIFRYDHVTDKTVAMVSSIKILHSALITNVFLLVAGLTVCLIDLDEYSWGLYMVLVAIVGLIICIAFCLLGPEDQPEPLAKKMWSRMTVKSSAARPSPNRRKALIQDISQQQNQNHADQCPDETDKPDYQFLPVCMESSVVQPLTILEAHTYI